MKIYSLKSKIDGIQEKEQIHARVWPKSDIDFLRGIKVRSKKSLKIFAGGAILLLLLTLAPGYFSRSFSQSKRILGTATTGFELLKSGEFAGALERFLEAQEALKSSRNVLSEILNMLPAGLDPANLLAAGTLVSEAANLAAEGFDEFLRAKIVWDEAANSSNQDLYLGLKVSREKIQRAAENLANARSRLSGINPNLLSQEYRLRFVEAQSQLDLVSDTATQLLAFQELLLGLLGGEKKTYIFIFQNNNEMRATGGFIGTYGILEFESGRVRIDRIESIYALDGQLHELIAAPGPLRRQQTQHWGMRDANWFADFPASARKILEFLEKEGGILADGVIALTPDVFEELLKITGPIDLPAYRETLNAQNFRATSQYKTSLDYDPLLNQPKKFLADFAPRFLSSLQNLDTSDWLSVLNVLYSQVSEKQIMAFSVDPAVEEQFEDLGVDGKIKATGGDYLLVVHSNVGGGKTDQHILQKIEKRVSLDSGGLAIVRLKITRTHNGFDELFFPKNIDFMRILVPRQAKLLSASGFDYHELLSSSVEGAAFDPDLQAWDQSIDYDANTRMYVGQETGYIFFANFLELLPGETKTVELAYEIQFTSGQAYTQLVQKQPGSAPFEFNLSVNYLPGEIAYFYPETFEKNGSELRLSETITADKFYGVIGQ